MTAGQTAAAEKGGWEYTRESESVRESERVSVREERRGRTVTLPVSPSLSLSLSHGVSHAVWLRCLCILLSPHLAGFRFSEIMIIVIYTHPHSHSLPASIPSYLSINICNLRCLLCLLWSTLSPHSLDHLCHIAAPASAAKPPTSQPRRTNKEPPQETPRTLALLINNKQQITHPHTQHTHKHAHHGRRRPARRPPRSPGPGRLARAPEDSPDHAAPLTSRLPPSVLRAYHYIHHCIHHHRSNRFSSTAAPPTLRCPAPLPRIRVQRNPARRRPRAPAPHHRHHDLCRPGPQSPTRQAPRDPDRSFRRTYCLLLPLSTFNSLPTPTNTPPPFL